MAGEKTTRELIYETNRDVKWICKALQRMEARGGFESRLRALEGWRAERTGGLWAVNCEGAQACG